LFQEDVPEEFASHILNFISRNKIGPNGVEVSYPLFYLDMLYMHSFVFFSFPYSPNAWCHAFLRYLVSLKNGVTKQNVQETAPVLTSFRKLVTSLLSLGRGELHENQNDP
jgi:hypothetical protein